MHVPYCCPICQSPLRLFSETLLCEVDNIKYGIINSVPRFCSNENYSESFGFQWNKFNHTQLDVYSGVDQSEDRFYLETGWVSDSLDNSLILEVGSGAGRFSEVFLRTTDGTLYSVDYSSAVDANKQNNQIYGDRLRLSQSSIYALPFRDNTFDKIFCLGVLQHTPSFEDSVGALIQKAKPGGEIVVDFYHIKGWYTRIHSKYLFRPFLKRLPKQFLLALIKLNIGWMLGLFDLLCKLRLGIFTRFIPITDVRGFPRNLSPSQRREWAIMDTFDAFSPQYDNPKRLEEVVSMFVDRRCKITFAGLIEHSSGTAMVVRAVKMSKDKPEMV